MRHTSQLALLAIALGFGVVRAEDVIPIPDAPSIQAAEKTTKEIFKDDYAKAKPEDRLALASTFLSEATKQGIDPASKYVLLREAVLLALQGGDGKVSQSAAKVLATTFGVDSVAIRVEMLQKVVPTLPPPLCAKLTLDILRWVDEPAASESPALSKIVPLVDAVAVKSQDAPLLKRVKARMAEVKELDAEAAKAKAARATLEKTPDDPAANTVAGRFATFYQGKPEVGLPLLKKGNDSTFKALASAEDPAPPDGAAQAKVGDRWAEAALKLKEPMKRFAQKRAMHWYKLALPQVSGLEKKRVEKQMAAIVSAPSESGTVPGLYAAYWKLDAGEPIEFKAFVTGRVEPNCNLSVARPKEVPGDRFGTFYSGVIRIKKAGPHQFHMYGDDRVRLWIDDEALIPKRVWGDKVTIELSEGDHAFKLEYTQLGGAAILKPLWTPPGETEQPIPPDILFNYDWAVSDYQQKMP